MKLAILIPSLDYRENAGTRIRYDRLFPYLASAGVEAVLLDVADFDPDAGGYDAILLSKVHDVRGLLAASKAARAGMAVGVDLFDDYFSQVEDPRLNRYRRWFAALLARLDFAIASTEAMADLVRQRRPDLAVRVVRDTAEAIDGPALRAAIERKLAVSKDEQCLRIGWYGVGDNPHFPVGLSDLKAFSLALHRLSRAARLPVRLTILTNDRALDAAALAALRDLPVRHQIRSWSLEAERALLDESFAIFLPVNAQPFSMAKSPNRAITALSAGCQVLSIGHHLYADFEPIIYRDPDEMAKDWAEGDLRLGVKHLDAAIKLLDGHASSETEARGLAEFLATVPRGSGAQDGQLAVIHGARPVLHRLGKLMDDVLQIASPYAPQAVTADVYFLSSVGPGLFVDVSAGIFDGLDGDAREGAVKVAANGSGPRLRLRAASSGEGEARDFRAKPIALQLVRYREIQDAVRGAASRLFGPVDFLDNEQSELPFPIPGEGLNA